MKIAWKALLIFFALTSIALCDPLKVTDPANPQFDPDRFSFRDYPLTRESRIETFRTLFPVGTPKAFVDRVLIDAGHGRSVQSKDDPQLWHYAEPPLPGFPPGPSHMFVFDENDKLINIHPTMSSAIYSDQPTMDDIRELRRSKKHGKENNAAPLEQPN